MDGRRNFILLVHDLNQTFVDLINNSVSLKNRNLDIECCCLRYNSEEELVLWRDPLKRWLQKKETIVSNRD